MSLELGTVKSLVSYITSAFINTVLRINLIVAGVLALTNRGFVDRQIVHSRFGKEFKRYFKFRSRSRVKLQLSYSKFVVNAARHDITVLLL